MRLVFLFGMNFNKTKISLINLNKKSNTTDPNIWEKRQEKNKLNKFKQKKI